MPGKSRNGNAGRHLRIDGLPIKDATKEMYITVTKTDISRASTKDPAKCAVAKACERAMGTEARVHLGRVYIKQGNGWMRFQTPSTMRNELLAFDRGGGFEPRTFRLTPVAPSRRATGKTMGGPNKGRPDHSNQGKRVKRQYHVTHNVRQHAAAEGSKV